MLAIPHTITRDEYSHCAFTGKVKRFAPMMRSRGFEVYHYGVETSESGANKDIDILTKDEWNILRIESYKKLHPTLSEFEIITRLEDPRSYVGDLANYNTPLYSEFNKRLRSALIENYRSVQTDIVCLPFGPAHDGAIQGLNLVHVESGIGYPNSCKTFRIFESYAKLHMVIEKEKKQVQNYWFVVPNYFNTVEFPISLNPKRDTIGFLGRMEPIKGCHIIVEVARKFRHVQFILCGQGDPSPYLVEPNVVYKTPIHGDERGVFLGSLTAMMAPSKFCEPFCGSAVEAQLCGTPVITSDFGAFTETVEQFKTGVRCHTLADFCYGVQMALDGKFDRQYIHDRAVKLYDMYNVAVQYEYAFKSIMDISNGNGGWFAKKTHVELLQEMEGHSSLEGNFRA